MCRCFVSASSLVYLVKQTKKNCLYCTLLLCYSCMISSSSTKYQMYHVSVWNLGLMLKKYEAQWQLPDRKFVLCFNDLFYNVQICYTISKIEELIKKNFGMNLFCGLIKVKELCSKKFSNEIKHNTSRIKFLNITPSK